MKDSNTERVKLLKILIVDDHALFREGLCYVLDKIEGEVSILEASDYENAFNLLTSNPDLNLVLLDLCMPGKDGFSLLEMASEKFPMIPIVVLSASKDISDMNRSMAAGAMGYIPKDATGKLMVGAINLVLSGGLYIPPDMVTNQNNDISDKKDVSLTQRQTEVMAMLAKGLSNKVIAADLEITEATIKMHITSIMKSLGVSNRTQAVIAAQKLGILTS